MFPAGSRRERGTAWDGTRSAPRHARPPGPHGGRWAEARQTRQRPVRSRARPSEGTVHARWAALARPKAAARSGMLRSLPAACLWRVTRAETVPPTGHTQTLSLAAGRPQFALDLGSKARLPLATPSTASCFLLPSPLGHVVRRTEASRVEAGRPEGWVGLGVRGAWPASNPVWAERDFPSTRTAACVSPNGAT